jgi:hypothetical protein
MSPLTYFLRSAAVLWSLVAGNLAALLLYIFLAFFAIPPKAFGMLFDHWVFAGAGGMAFAQVLLLALWTAFYDPKWPVRWLAIAAILLVADLCVVVEFSTLIHWHYDNYFGRSDVSWVDGHAYQLSVTAAGVSLVVALGLTMFLHASCWPLRSMLGWRIEFAGARQRSDSARQFSIVQLFAWVGFFAIFFFLLRSLLVEQWFLGPILLCSIGSVAAAVNVLPWFVLLRFQRLRTRQFLLLGLIMVGSLLLTWIEKEVTAFLNGGSATRLMVPNFFPQFAAFNLTAAGVAALNLFILRVSGARLRSFATTQSTATQRIPINVAAE